MSSALNTLMSHITPRSNKRPVNDTYHQSSTSSALIDNNTQQSSTQAPYNALQRAFAYSSTAPSCTTAKRRTVKGSHAWIIRGFTDLPLTATNEVNNIVEHNNIIHNTSNTTLLNTQSTNDLIHTHNTNNNNTGATSTNSTTTLSATDMKLKPFVHSQEFEIGGYRWKMELWPNGDTVTSSDSEGWITLYLCCCTQLKDTQELRRRAEFRFLNWCTPDSDMVCSLGWATYSAAQPAWGRRKALQRNDLLNNSQWLQNDQLILVCEVEVDLGVSIEHIDAVNTLYESIHDVTSFSKVAKDYMYMLSNDSSQDVTLICHTSNNNNTIIKSNNRHTMIQLIDGDNENTDQPRADSIPNNKRRRINDDINCSTNESSDDSVEGLDVPHINSNQVRAHKSILMSRSKVFSAMFRNDYIEKNANQVPLYGITVCTLKQLLQYIYTGAIAVVNLQQYNQLSNNSNIRTDDARQPQSHTSSHGNNNTNNQLKQSSDTAQHIDGIGCNRSILNDMTMNQQYAPPITTWNQAIELYDAAVYYDVPDCAIDCAKLIGRTLTVDNAAAALQFVLNHSTAPGIDIVKSYLKPYTQ